MKPETFEFKNYGKFPIILHDCYAICFQKPLKNNLGSISAWSFLQSNTYTGFSFYAVQENLNASETAPYKYKIYTIDNKYRLKEFIENNDYFSPESSEKLIKCYQKFMVDYANHIKEPTINEECKSEKVKFNKHTFSIKTLFKYITYILILGYIISTLDYDLIINHIIELKNILYNFLFKSSV